MKKILIICLCLGCILSTGGCSPDRVFHKYILKEDTEATVDSVPKPRVYMDEITGLFTDFDGNHITLTSGDGSYVFDVSQASVECSKGLISGDSISVIYEGQLFDSNTNTVKALKIVDDFHNETSLKEEILKGKLQGLTSNTITIQNKDGNNISYPITGTEQYFQNGIKKGNTVYLHSTGSTGNIRYVKIRSISDTEPLKIPDSISKSISSGKNKNQKSTKQFHGVIQDINMNLLQVLPDGSETPLNINLSSLPCHFESGIAPGASVNVFYTGEFQTNTLDGISVVAVTGDIPKSKNRISSTITGTIAGSTANTLSIETTDGAFITCNREDATNSSTGGLLSGSTVKITFDPKSSKTSNIYKCIKIEDA